MTLMVCFIKVWHIGTSVARFFEDKLDVFGELISELGVDKKLVVG